MAGAATCQKSGYACFLFTIFLLCRPSAALHIKGTWSSNQFFKFLAKFGFQKTDLFETKDTQGYIFGNVTMSKDAKYNASVSDVVTLVVVDREYFVEYYGNRTLDRHSFACARMFAKIQTMAYDAFCDDDGQEDFIRKVPCFSNQLCSDEDDPNNVVPGYQFTYNVQDLNQPRFWYISFAACQRTGEKVNHCHWRHSPNISIDYDIWLVNGNPYAKHKNPLEYQFSFDQVDTVEIYLACLALYVILTGIEWWFGFRHQQHELIKLFFACLSLQTFASLLDVVHMLWFAMDGIGCFTLQIMGNVITTIAQSVFVLLLLMIAKGWRITTMHISYPGVMFTVWGSYTCVNIFLYVWNLTEISVISDVDEYQTWPGYLMLVFRTIIMFWFLFELRCTYLQEEKSEKLQFYLHFGAGMLVWFVYLPVLAIVASQVSALWRFKLLLGITSAANLLYYMILMNMLWPSRSDSYFQIQNNLEDDDVEDYENEVLQCRKGKGTD